MSWLTRSAISLATVTQHIKHFPAPDSSPGVYKIDIEQTVTGGFKASPEYRTTDWTERTHNDRIFGELVGRSRYVKPEDIEDAMVGGDKDWFAEGWDEEGEKVQSWVENREAGWTACQVWGFAVVEGTRYYVRRVVVKKGEERIRARLVYNYVGELKKQAEKGE